MRRPHRKTRTGCGQCRQRHIKCGEEKPNCAHCVRHSLSCRFEEPKQRASPRTRTSTRTSTRSVSPAAGSTSDQCRSPAVRSTWIVSTPSAQPVPFAGSRHETFSRVHLELMHLYTTVTYRSFSANRDELWQGRVPKVSMEHPFLMHGLLAMAALHLADLEPHRRKSLHGIAIAHEMLALPAFRASVDRVDETNSTAVFAFGAFVVAYSSAASSLAAEDVTSKARENNSGDIYGKYNAAGFGYGNADEPTTATPVAAAGVVSAEHDDPDLPPRWLLLLRSAFSLFATSAPLLKVGIVPPASAPPMSSYTDPEDVRLTALHPLLTHTTSSRSVTATLSPGGARHTTPYANLNSQHHRQLPLNRSPLSTIDAAEARTALDALRTAMALPQNTPLSHHAAAYLWPGLLGSGFMDAIARRVPEALVVLAHYCVLLQRGESGHHSWYLRGQARQILTSIVRCLRAWGDDWVAWIEWPVACVLGDGQLKLCELSSHTISDGRTMLQSAGTSFDETGVLGKAKENKVMA